AIVAVDERVDRRREEEVVDQSCLCSFSSLLSPLSCSIRQRRMEAAGIEPARDLDGIINPSCACGKCEEWPARTALHSPPAGWLDLASLDADLLSVVLAWERMSEPIRKAIVTLATG